MLYPEELEYHLSKVPYIAESMVWGDEGDDGSNDTSIVATVTLDAEEVIEALSEECTEEEVRKLIWDEVDKINEELPFYKKIKKD